MISIRNCLVGLILGAFAFCIALLALMNFYYIRQELMELTDADLKQLAIAVPHYQDEIIHGETSRQGNLDREEDFLVQIWRNGQLIHSTHPNIEIPLQERGFGNVSWKGEQLRYYQHTSEGQVTQVVQSFDERQEMINDVLWHFFITVLLLIPIVVILVYRVVGHGLLPLVALSSNVRERGADNLTLIDLFNVPTEVCPLVESLNQLLKRLKGSLMLQRRFTADAAHELRTPLAAVQLQMDMLERAETPAERQEVEASLKAGVERAIHLVKNLLQLARYENDTTGAAFEQVDMASLTRRVLRELEPFVVEKALNINLKTKPGQALFVNAQGHNMAVMIENLLQNAMTYTQPGGSILVELEADHQGLTFSVADDGPGIKPEDRVRVFDRFYRCLGTKKQGSGLGLSVVKNIVDNYQGKISIREGINGKGCQFVVVLPCK